MARREWSPSHLLAGWVGAARRRVSWPARCDPLGALRAAGRTTPKAWLNHSAHKINILCFFQLLTLFRLPRNHARAIWSVLVNLKTSRGKGKVCNAVRRMDLPEKGRVMKEGAGPYYYSFLVQRPQKKKADAE